MKPNLQSSLDDWLYYIEHLHDKPMDLGLDRVTSVAQKMALLKPAPFVITVAGTNGKGTTCHALEMILIEAGFHVGVYASPHLIHYTERVRIQHQDVSDQAMIAAFSKIEAARQGVSLSYFEFGTLAALALFIDNKVDIAILEVGLGGRLDATNSIDADIAVITSIGLDHIQWLGDDREKIGHEKAGIFRANTPAVIGEPDMPQSILHAAQKIGASLYTCYPNKNYNWSYQQTENTWSFSSHNRRYTQLPLPKIPLPNAATALATLSCSPFDIDIKIIRTALDKMFLPGRLQTISWHPRVIVDVAHNPHASAYLAKQLAAMIKPGTTVRAVVGMLADKDIQATLSHLSPLVTQWYYAPLSGSRGASLTEMKKVLPQGSACDTITSAWQQALNDANSDEIIVVMGSFVTVSEVLANIKQQGESN